jgi:hypothetical protein
MGFAYASAIGRGNEIVCFAINEVAKRIIGMDVDSIFADMGAFFNFRKHSLPFVTRSNGPDTAQSSPTRSTAGSARRRV